MALLRHLTISGHRYGFSDENFQWKDNSDKYASKHNLGSNKLIKRKEEEEECDDMVDRSISPFCCGPLDNPFL